MKILVVGENIVCQALAQVLGLFKDVEVIQASHEDALMAFLTENPSHVVVLDYDEHGDRHSSWSRGVQSFKDIKNSAGTEIVLRSGFSSYPYDDYIQQPFLVTGLVKRLFNLNDKEE